MRRWSLMILIFGIILAMAGCGRIQLRVTLRDHSPGNHQSPTEILLTEPATEQTIPPITQPHITVPTAPLHSQWYISGISAYDVITYFNEVALDTEFASGTGDAKLVQKWDQPIYYMLEGNYTQDDRGTIREFANFFNNMTGSPGMYETTNPGERNLRICFTDSQGIVDILGNNLEGADGGVTYWYEDDRIYDSTICIATYLEGAQRCSVILEELYNGSGLSQDTILRTDSLIYSYSDDAQWMTPVDQLLLMLLYHPQIQPGMNATQCEQVIRSLYY
ncbi:MAG: DUF2927 domain-containing protein [Oscillospiraceae bacterium]|nr:DUF2927 domain-containing protein [Oscillospiraceae bacterium]